MNELDCGDYVHYKDIPEIKQLWLDRDDLLSEYLKLTRSVKEIKQKLRENKRKIVELLKGTAWKQLSEMKKSCPEEKYEDLKKYIDEHNMLPQHFKFLPRSFLGQQSCYYWRIQYHQGVWDINLPEQLHIWNESKSEPQICSWVQRQQISIFRKFMKAEITETPMISYFTLIIYPSNYKDIFRIIPIVEGYLIKPKLKWPAGSEEMHELKLCECLNLDRSMVKILRSDNEELS